MQGFGHQLKDLRNRFGLTQADLAKASNLGPSTISAIETGRQNPWPSTRRALARAFRMTLEEFDVQITGLGPLGTVPRPGDSHSSEQQPIPGNGPPSSHSLEQADTEATVLRLVQRLQAAEDRLGQTEQQLSLLQRALEQLPILLWTTDAQLRVRSAHGCNSEWLGRHQDSLAAWLDEYLHDVLRAPNHDFGALDAHRRALGGAVTTSAVEWNGHVFGLIVEPQRDAEGRVTGTVALAVEVPRGDRKAIR